MSINKKMDAIKKCCASAIIFSLSAVFDGIPANAETVDVSTKGVKQYGFDNYTVQRNPNKVILKIPFFQSISLYSHLENTPNEHVVFYSKKLPTPDFTKCETLSLSGAFFRLQKRLPATIVISGISNDDLDATQKANCAQISLKEARKKLNIKPR
jgi:hypothetical protein